jgi:hypothetical protein
MDIKLFKDFVLPAFSVVISLIAIIVSFMSIYKNRITSIKPVLIFSLNSEKKWCIDNVGNGAAINIIFSGSNNINKEYDKIPFNPSQTILIPTIGINKRLHITWEVSDAALIAIYSDMSGKKYSSICQENTHTLFSRNIKPDLKAQRYLWQKDIKLTQIDT